MCNEIDQNGILNGNKRECYDGSALVRNTNIIECLLEVASPVEGLEFGVATDVFAADEDVGDSALASDVFELVLHISTPRDLVKFDDPGIDSLLLKE